MTHDDTPRSRPASVGEGVAALHPSLVHHSWAEDFPWLVQSTTTRGEADHALDFGLFGDGSAAERVVQHRDDLLATTGMKRVVHARQVHGREVRVPQWGTAGPQACRGVRRPPRRGAPGVLLAVTTADYVPVFVVDPRRRVAGVVHAGWRGVAAGVLEEALAILAEKVGSRAGDLHVHLGPAICGGF